MRASNPLVLSYVALRRSIGILGVSLPLLLFVLAGEPGPRVSISSYYDSAARDVFVAILCSIGVFLLCYRGYDRVDNILTSASGVAAIGVALFPVSGFGWIHNVHLVCAGTMFTLTAVMSTFQFRKGDPPASEDAVYIACGVVIAASIVCISLSQSFRLGGVFWPETAAIEAFGAAWLVKGRALRVEVKLQ